MENLDKGVPARNPEAQGGDMPVDSGAPEASGFRAVPIPTSLIRTTIDHFGSGRLVELTQVGDRIILKLDKDN